MAEKVIMPKQGLQMTEGTILKWLYSEGDKVEEGKPLFEMETDKLTIEIEAPASGTLLKIVKGEGETVPITELIGVIGKEGEDISDILKEADLDGDKEQPKEEVENAQEEKEQKVEKVEKVERKPGERVFITPRAKMRAEDAEIDYEGIIGTGPEGLIIEKDVLKAIEEGAKGPKATPLAKKVAAMKGVDLSQVEGTGARGKIMRKDVEGKTVEMPAASEQEETVIPFTGMRKAIADNMMKSLQTMAQANHRMKVDMTELIRFREKLKAEDVKVSYNDILVKIVSKALLDNPIVNSSVDGENIVMKHYVNMGLAVAIDKGLIVPVVKGADKMSLKQISDTSKELIEKARSGKLKPDEYRGGTFTISNLGMYDIDEFTAVINPPQSAILAVGKINKEPVVVENDKIEIKPIMVLSLTYDHRIIDGSDAAIFLQRVKQIMQNPYLLI